MCEEAIAIKSGVIGIQAHIRELKRTTIRRHAIVFLAAMLNAQKLFRLHATGLNSVV
jgi:hypothetical protein